MAPDSDAGTPPECGRALLISFAVLQIAMLVARGVAPLLLTRAPLASAVLDGRTATTLLLVDRLSPTAFVVGATLGFVLGDLLAFPIGRVYGDRATQAIGLWLPTTGALLSGLERFMAATRGAPLILSSGYAASAVAGASGVGWAAFLFFNLSGVAVRLLIVLRAADAFDEQVAAAGAVVERFVVPFTVVSLLLVVVDFAVGRARRRRRHG